MYTAIYGTSRRLELNMVNKIDVIPIGSLTDDTNVYCEGESVHINRKIVNIILKLQTFKVIIQEQSYLVKESTVELRSNHAVLPGPSALRLQVPTYGYLHKLGKIRTIHGQHQGSWFIDQQHSLIINITGNINPLRDVKLMH